MPEFKVNGMVTVSCWTVVEAKSLQEAIEIAKRRSMAEIHIDGSYEENECWHIDVDGEPENLRGDDA